MSAKLTKAEMDFINVRVNEPIFLQKIYYDLITCGIIYQERTKGSKLSKLAIFRSLF
jgi:hypothetical protein